MRETETHNAYWVETLKEAINFELNHNVLYNLEKLRKIIAVVFDYDENKIEIGPNDIDDDVLLFPNDNDPIKNTLADIAEQNIMGG